MSDRQSILINKKNPKIKRKCKNPKCSKNTKNKDQISDTKVIKKIILMADNMSQSATADNNCHDLNAEVALLKNNYAEIKIQNEKLKLLIDELNEYNQKLIKKINEFESSDNMDCVSENSENTFDNNCQVNLTESDENNQDINNEDNAYNITNNNRFVSLINNTTDTYDNNYPNIPSTSQNKKHKLIQNNNKTNINTINPSNKKIRINNYEPNINDSQVCQSQQLSSQTSNPIGPSSSSININNSINNQNITKTINKTEKMPPIITYNINVKDIITKLNASIGSANFSIKRINKNVTHLLTASIDNFLKAMNIVKSEKINFFSYTPAALKQHSLLLKGIDGSYTEVDIKEALKELQISQYIVKISKYNPNKSLKNNSYNYWILQCTPDTDLSIFFNIKYILNQKIKIEKLLKREIIQCKNCQRYGHAASNCNMQYRCVKCAENHAPGNCQKLDRNTNPFCINCKQDDHPANYRQCPKYKELMARKEQQKNQNREKEIAKQHMFNRYINPSISYASVTATNRFNQAVNKPKIIPHKIPTVETSHKSPWDQACGDMFGLNLVDTLRSFQDFVPKFNAISDPINKKIALFKFFANVNSL